MPCRLALRLPDKDHMIEALLRGTTNSADAAARLDPSRLPL